MNQCGGAVDAVCQYHVVGAVFFGVAFTFLLGDFTQLQIGELVQLAFGLFVARLPLLNNVG